MPSLALQKIIRYISQKPKITKYQNYVVLTD